VNAGGFTARRLTCIHALLGKTQTTAIVDTGADAAFVSRSLCAAAKIQIDSTRAHGYSSVSDANCRTLGMARLPLGIGGERFYIDAHVVDTGSWCLLIPAPFLRSVGAKIDLESERLIFRSPPLSVPLLAPLPVASVSPAEGLMASVDDRIFVPERNKEIERWTRLYPLPDEESIARRLRMGTHSTKADRSAVMRCLKSLPRLAREYPPNAPPPLPLRPICLEFEDGARPPHIRQWPMSPAMRTAKEEMLESWMKYGIVERSQSFGSVPVFPVPKGDSDWRLVIDSRAVNELLVPVRHNPPLLATVHAWLAPATFVSSIDAASFFHSFVIAPESRRYFAFDAGKLGRCQLTRLPQGSSVAPAVASAFLERVLQPVSDIAISYVDNIVIRSTSPDVADHHRCIRRVLDVLEKAGVTLNLKSSVWCGVQDVPVMGVLWSRGSLRLTDRRVSDLLSMPKPATLSQVRSMTAALSTMSSFIPNAALLAAPFNRLAGAGRAFKWDDSLAQSFEAIRKAVKHALVTFYPQPGDELIVRSDASLVGWGGVLIAERNGVERPVVFVSRAWKGAEAKYSAVRREAIGLVNVVQRLQPYIKGDRRVRYETDSSAVAAILRHQGDDQLTMIAIKLSELGVRDTDLHHVPGAGNAIADWASRIPSPDDGATDPGQPQAVLATRAHASRAVPLVVPKDDKNAVVTISQQQQDPELRPIIDLCAKLEASVDDEVVVDGPAILRDGIQRFRLVEGLLMRIEYGSEDDADSPGRLVVVVPRQHRHRVLEFFHRAYGHLRGRRFAALLRSRVWFAGMLSEAEHLVRCCHTCQLAAGGSNTLVGRGIRDPAGVGAHVYLDVGHVGDDGAAAQQQFLVMVDQASGLIAAAGLPNRTADEIVGALHSHWVRPFGPPGRITVDGAREFQSIAMRSYLARYGIKHISSSPYNPSANIAETAVKKVKDGLRRALMDARHDPSMTGVGWTQILDAVTHNWNVTVSEATGNSPAMLFFGRTLRHPADVGVSPPVTLGDGSGQSADQRREIADWTREIAAERRDVKAQRRAAYFDRASQRLVLPDGSLVVKFVQRTSPLGKCIVRRTGPYRVVARVSDSNYKLAHTDGTPIEGHIHVRWLAPYFMPAGGIPTGGPNPSDAWDMDLEDGPQPPAESPVRAEPQPLGVEPPLPMESVDGLEPQPHDTDRHAKDPSDIAQNPPAAPNHRAALPEPRSAVPVQPVPMESAPVANRDAVPLRRSERIAAKMQARNKASHADSGSAG